MASTLEFQLLIFHLLDWSTGAYNCQLGISDATILIDAWFFQDFLHVFSAEASLSTNFASEVHNISKK